MKTIVVANNKGGVGKTTIASQIVYSLSARGHSVLGVDLDSQRNFSASFEGAKTLGNALDLVTRGEGVKADLESGEIGVVTGHKDLQSQNADDVMANVQAGLVGSSGADFCVVDTPPNFGEAVYGALIAADYLLVPIELKKYSVDGIEGVLEALYAAQGVNPKLQLLGILPSRFDAVKQIERDAMVQVAEAVGDLCVPYAIRNRTAYVVAQEEGVPLAEVKTKSGKDAQEEFGQFFDWLYDKLGEGK